ncbi:MAG TPA: hypothetical protein VGG42_13055 [Acidobacteriaceae bacterium]|jgi:hypothetical protein
MRRRIFQSEWVLAAVAGLLIAAPMAPAQNENQGHGQATVTVLPKNSKTQGSDVTRQAVEVSVNGKKTAVSTWQPQRDDRAAVEVVLLIDQGARTSLGRELGDITHFVQNLPPNVKFTIGYMENGRAALSGPLTADHAQALRGLHLPSGEPEENGSPYFCLSDLAKHWPSSDPEARREVIMITDGVDYYERRYDPQDPYVLASIQDSVRAHMVVYSIYWRNTGFLDRTGYANYDGQNLLAQVTQATGGNSYWIGLGNPVALQPYFEDFSRRLQNQYELGFTVPLRGKAQEETLKVKVKAAGTSVTAPQQVWIAPGEAMQQP